MNDFPQAPASQPSRRRGCLRVLVLFAIVLFLLASALTFFVVRWQSSLNASSIKLTDADPELNIARRFLLQNYLVENERALNEPVGPGVDTAFQIVPGARADTVADDLFHAGLINDRALFLSYLIFYGLDSRLRAGQFTLNGQMTIPEMVAAISEGSALDVTIRFLNGLRLEEMADYLAVASPAEIDAGEFLALARREKRLDLSPYSFLNSLEANGTLEGFLFPGRYQVPTTADAEYLIHEMLRNFDRQVTPAMRQAYGAQQLTLPQAVILASIVERETPLDAERPLIASVYTNRIREGMPLQADPTVQYAVGYQADSRNWWKVPLSLADLKFNHPYNTYVIPGLPPGPIANPGLASLQAIAEPAQTNFLFFVLDCESNPPGRHVFSKTYEEHLANAQRCR